MAAGGEEEGCCNAHLGSLRAWLVVVGFETSVPGSCFSFLSPVLRAQLRG